MQTIPLAAMRSLPGEELITRGLEDLRQGRETEAALLVQIAAPRLRKLGLDVPAGPTTSGEPAEHRLYALLANRSDAHSQYNALLARVASYARAAEHATAR